MILCPVCGYELEFTPWKGGDESPDRHCDCCGLCFGLDDLFATDRDELYKLWRYRWIRDGKRWWSIKPEPPDFNPEEQLKRLYT